MASSHTLSRSADSPGYTAFKTVPASLPFILSCSLSVGEKFHSKERLDSKKLLG